MQVIPPRLEGALPTADPARDHDAHIQQGNRQKPDCDNRRKARAVSRDLDAEPGQQQAQHHAPRISHEHLAARLPGEAHVHGPESQQDDDRRQEQLGRYCEADER